MRAITLEGAKRMDFDFLVSSVIQHERPYKTMIEQYHPRAAHIRQMGNVNDTCDFSICRNVMNSTMNPIPPEVNTVTYNQEFSLADYRPQQAPLDRVYSFLNVMPQVKDYPLWLAMKREMPDYDWRSYGIICDDGNLPSYRMPEAVRSASFVCHLKWWGDGFGHIIHEAAASGKPILTKGAYYSGMMGGRLLEDGITFIDLSDDVAKNAEKIRYWSDPDRYETMSRCIYRRFRQVVDFEADLPKIRAFLDRARPV